MDPSAATVFVVDDDPAVLKALRRLLRVHGFDVRSFASSRAFLDLHDPTVPGCVVLDISLPGLNGLELQEALAVSGAGRFIIFITGRADIPTTVRAMKAGAVDFLTKPFDDKDLLRAIRAAIEKDRVARENREEAGLLQVRLAALTRREREVLEHVVAGELNKQIAGDLGTVEKTIKVHRARMMAKMGATSVAALVRMADRVGIKPADKLLPVGR